MEIDGIHLLRISTPFLVGNVNTYLIVSPEPTLIDVPPNDEIYIKELEEALREKGYLIKDIRRIIITHPHFDHFGSVARIVEKSGAEVCISSEGARWLEDFEKEFIDDDLFYRDFLKKAGVPPRMAEYSSKLYNRAKRFGCQARVSKYLTEGDRIALSSGKLEVISLPGHTPWCIGLYESQKGILFTGDFLLKEISSNALLQRPWVVPSGYKSLKAYISSLNKANALNIKFALPGHGEIIENPVERIEELLFFISRRKQAISQILKRNGKITPYEIMLQLFPNLPDEQLFLGISEVMGYLELLEDEGSARKIEKGLIYFLPITP